MPTLIVCDCQAKLRVLEDAGSKAMRCPRCGSVCEVAELIHEDSVIREYLKTRVGPAHLDAPGSSNRTRIERTQREVLVTIHSTQGGEWMDEDDKGIDQLTRELEDLTRRLTVVRFEPVNATNLQLEQLRRKLENAEDERRLELEVVEGNDPQGKAPESGSLPPTRHVPRSRVVLRAVVKAALVAIATGIGTQVGGWVGGFVVLLLSTAVAASFGIELPPHNHK